MTPGIGLLNWSIDTQSPGVKWSSLTDPEDDFLCSCLAAIQWAHSGIGQLAISFGSNPFLASF